MSLVFVIWTLFCFGCFVVSGNPEGERRGSRVKRIFYGLELDSHESFHTQYMVSVKRAHGCDTAKWKSWEHICEYYNHMCGGALIAPDMVVTNCHCMAYEHFRVKGVKLPPYHPSFDEWTTSTEVPDVEEDLQTFYFKVQPFHPIYHLLSLWMGSLDIEEMPQRQFAKAFFPHSECTFREILVLGGGNTTLKDELWDRKKPDYDIGLIRTWESFTINKDVNVVPLILGDELLQFHQSVMKKMSACLLTGFGLTEYGIGAWRLRYAFRHMQCTSVCQLDPANIHQCEVCSTSIARPDKGIPISWAHAGDSGSPIVCDYNGRNVLFSVHSQVIRDKFVFHTNVTVSISIAIACVKDLLTPENMKYLKELDDQNRQQYFKLDQIAMGPFERNLYTGPTTTVVP